MRRRRIAAVLPLAIVLPLASLAGSPQASAAGAPAPAPRTDITGVVQRLADGDDHAESSLALRMPDGTYVPVGGGVLASARSGSTVTATVDIPADVVAAAHDERTVAGVGDERVGLDEGDLARAQLAPASATSDLSSATAASSASSQRQLLASAVRVVAAEAPAATFAPGAHTLTVAIVVPQGARGAVATESQVKSQIAGASAYWSEASAGRITLRPGTIGRPYASSQACTSDYGSYRRMWTEAATRLRFTPGANRHLVLALPRGSNCAYGLAEIGSGVNGGGNVLVSDVAWPVLAHEIGHNFGLDHARALRCTKRDVDLTALPAGCSVSEYGYPWDIMAQSAQDRGGSLSSVQQVRVGLMGRKDYVDVDAGSRTITLRPMSSDSGVRAARVVDSRSGATYYVEYRTRTGRDARLYQEVPSGVRVLRADTTTGTGLGSIVLDMTPTGSPNDIVRQLAPGATFTTYAGGAWVRTNSAGATASVTVGVGAAPEVARGVPAAPLVTVPAVTATAATGPNAVVAWSGGRSGDRYDVEYRAVGADGRAAATRTWFTGTTATRGTLRGAYGGVYQVRVRIRAADGTLGAWSPWRTTVAATDAASGARLAGAWRTGRAGGYYAGTYASTVAAGASLTGRPTPSRTITLVGPRHAKGATAKVYVDGRLRATVSTYAPRTRQRQVLATIQVPLGAHVVRIVNVPTRGRTSLVLDAVAYGR